MTSDLQQKRDTVLRVGEVVEVSGRRIFVSVDGQKNLSDLFFNGEFVRNVSVNSYIEIRKGFLSLTGKVDGERVEEKSIDRKSVITQSDRNKRTPTISLVGFIDKNGVFFGGTRELPLIGNEAYLVTPRRIHEIHRLVSPGRAGVTFAKTDYEDYRVEFPVDGLFNSHIAIFGNTGSGKSNTLASIFQSLVKRLSGTSNDLFARRCKFLLFDFNGEYSKSGCITHAKAVMNLSTQRENGDKIPIAKESLLDPELLSVLADATEKTQKPFLRRALRLFEHISGDSLNESSAHFQNILRQRIAQILQMSDKVRVDLLFDYLREILPPDNNLGEIVELASDLEWHNQSSEYKLRGTNVYLKGSPDRIPDTVVYQHAANFSLSSNILTNLISAMYLQLITDVLTNRAQNQHIAPAINKLKSKRGDIEKVLDTETGSSMWSENFVVINLNDVNLDMKKTLPLLLTKKEYQDQKRRPKNTSLSIIIDEAHNILSSSSSREAESWKDYRLETFEEVVKEGRKFGVFVTIASQRPSDISSTITSQAHNYFIHRLINQRDLATIASAVSYIDSISEESIPTLPTGTCIFSGTAGQMPLKLVIDKLEDEVKPESGTLEFDLILRPDEG
ncbi:ATP-binding protein [uncultured Mameliella sp.]|uniref:ATP-binding protein n=1 Tax=uncultured Mameliella sp. TaxID=1447087 RepID=UPI00261B1618|nr:ATP-binding protein [uncultured Mameliella sp.]